MYKIKKRYTRCFKKICTTWESWTLRGTGGIEKVHYHFRASIFILKTIFQIARRISRFLLTRSICNFHGVDPFSRHPVYIHIYYGNYTQLLQVRKWSWLRIKICYSRKVNLITTALSDQWLLFIDLSFKFLNVIRSYDSTATKEMKKKKKNGTYRYIYVFLLFANRLYFGYIRNQQTDYLIIIDISIA